MSSLKYYYIFAPNCTVENSKSGAARWPAARSPNPAPGPSNRTTRAHPTPSPLHRQCSNTWTKQKRIKMLHPQKTLRLVRNSIDQSWLCNNSLLFPQSPANLNHVSSYKPLEAHSNFPHFRSNLNSPESSTAQSASRPPPLDVNSIRHHRPPFLHNILSPQFILPTPGKYRPPQPSPQNPYGWNVHLKASKQAKWLKKYTTKYCRNIEKH